MTNKISFVLRVLDNETHLTNLADQKAISMLSVLGIFMIFFIAYLYALPINILTVILVIIYSADLTLFSSLA
jgi:hypothetical protein